MDFIDYDDARITSAPRRELPIRHVDDEVANRGEAPERIWWTGRQWCVTAWGIEARDGTYPIKRDRMFERLDQHSWIEHMSGKTWVDVEDFATAWLVAIALYGTRGEALLTAVQRSPVYPRRAARRPLIAE